MDIFDKILKNYPCQNENKISFKDLPKNKRYSDYLNEIYEIINKTPFLDMEYLSKEKYSSYTQTTFADNAFEKTYLEKSKKMWDNIDVWDGPVGTGTVPNLPPLSAAAMVGPVRTTFKPPAKTEPSDPVEAAARHVQDKYKGFLDKFVQVDFDKPV